MTYQSYGWGSRKVKVRKDLEGKHNGNRALDKSGAKILSCEGSIENLVGWFPFSPKALVVELPLQRPVSIKWKTIQSCSIFCFPTLGHQRHPGPSFLHLDLGSCGENRMVCLTVDDWNVVSVTDIEKGNGKGEGTRED